MNGTTRKVGRITVAIGLVALGAGLLMDNLLGSPGYTGWILRFWPVLLIGFGAEYLVFTALDRSDDGPPVRLRFDIGGAFLLMLLIVLVFGFSTIRHWIPNPQDFVMISPGTSSREETASVPLGDAKSVEIDIDLGRVELFSQKLSEVRVEASYTMHGVLRLRSEATAVGDFQLSVEEGETVRVRGDAPQGNLGGVSATYRVYIPEDMKVTLRTGAGSVVVRDYRGDLKLNSNLGTITVQASSGSLDLETGSGSIGVMDYTGPVVAKTNLGRIDMNQVTGALQLDSGTGSIQVNEFAGGKLVAETRTGSIQVDSRATLEGDLLLRTSTGSITLTLPQESSMKVSAQARTGSISAPNFLEMNRSGTSSSAVGTIGDGKHTVTLETGMGSINFNVR